MLQNVAVYPAEKKVRLSLPANPLPLTWQDLLQRIRRPRLPSPRILVLLHAPRNSFRNPDGTPIFHSQHFRRRLSSHRIPLLYHGF